MEGWKCVGQQLLVSQDTFIRPGDPVLGACYTGGSDQVISFSGMDRNGWKRQERNKSVVRGINARIGLATNNS